MAKLNDREQQKLTIRIQGPYVDPPAAIGQPDAVVVVTGTPAEAAMLLLLTIII